MLGGGKLVFCELKCHAGITLKLQNINVLIHLVAESKYFCLENFHSELIQPKCLHPTAVRLVRKNVASRLFGCLCFLERSADLALLPGALLGGSFYTLDKGKGSCIVCQV